MTRRYYRGSSYVGCKATDKEKERLDCHSTDPEAIKVAQSISDSSFVKFSCDEEDHLTLFQVANYSLYLP